ncbi:signal transducer and activator of transcription 6 isoform X2 [Polypterus senegalus]|uniref:signal transducer and activator of transcription 6 isoform X2 n=1 Tax=Polypterus senegalus TaxID=55291 RepID=UPI001962D9D3|nr:signal transducer and activator of transcription 6 isoform X2 [Polypterus senegalus]
MGSDTGDTRNILDSAEKDSVNFICYNCTQSYLKQYTRTVSLRMALWKKVQCLPTETLNQLYPTSFPIEVRHYMATWLEDQPWDDMDVNDLAFESRAKMLLCQITSYLLQLAEKNSDVVLKMRLQHIVKSMKIFEGQPLKLVKIVQEILKQERTLISHMAIGAPVQVQMQTQVHPHPRPGMSSPEHNPAFLPGPSASPQPPQLSASAVCKKTSTDDRDKQRAIEMLVHKMADIQACRKNLHHLQENVTWEKQNFESMQGQLLQNQKNGLLDQNLSETCNHLQNQIQRDELQSKVFYEKRVQMIQELTQNLAQTQHQVIQRIQVWKRQQHLSAIGEPFDDNLSILQSCCEQLLMVNLQLNQEIIIAGRESREEPFREMQEKLAALLKSLIQSSLIVDKQPPQVIKTQSKFSTTVRFLLGERMNSAKPAVIKAQIITEAQARNLGQPGSVLSENVGELINNSAILDHNAATKTTCCTFRNMSIKKIKRTDRKGSESVTEEKFALLFSSEINIMGCETTYSIQVISLPIVIIVHGSQDNNALATIIWDCAFSEPDRIPFLVPERVTWQQMCATLNSKFMSEVQTPRCLDEHNLRFLAQKIFDEPDINGDFDSRNVTWAQFNKEVLPGRSFTFWQWFDGVMELTKKHLKNYWTDRLIFGFIGKQYLHLLLQQSQDGTFLLRFSDSEIGGITIAYVSTTDIGNRQILNIQPFTKKDLEIRSLGDRIHDIEFIHFVYPNRRKDEAFNKYYTVPPPSSKYGYLPTSIQTKVEGEMSSVRMNGSSTPVISNVPSDIDPMIINYTEQPSTRINDVSTPVVTSTMPSEVDPMTFNFSNQIINPGSHPDLVPSTHQQIHYPVQNFPWTYPGRREANETYSQSSVEMLTESVQQGRKQQCSDSGFLMDPLQYKNSHIYRFARMDGDLMPPSNWEIGEMLADSTPMDTDFLSQKRCHCAQSSQCSHI